jgi:uncharacterized membrane protein YgdD (TMEM256/DUF423 family)
MNLFLYLFTTLKTENGSLWKQILVTPRIPTECFISSFLSIYCNLIIEILKSLNQWTLQLKTLFTGILYLMPLTRNKHQIRSLFALFKNCLLKRYMYISTKSHIRQFTSTINKKARYFMAHTLGILTIKPLKSKKTMLMDSCMDRA